MNDLSFVLDGFNYQFVSVDALEEFVLEQTNYAKQLSDCVDSEIDSHKRQTFDRTLSGVQKLISKAGELLNRVEGNHGQI
jgi:hypothetical protein